ncbi:MAG TPA: hypothetical protein VHW60_17740 [Caulobacteraceae bacterium]|jgi:hypothetical protein|nr:hypothetical protein [Caulobacteraceae bacterium]
MKLADDIIEGAEAIGAEIGVRPRRAFLLMEKGAIPAFKLLGKWHVRRSTLRAYIEKLERDAIAEGAGGSGSPV